MSSPQLVGPTRRLSLRFSSTRRGAHVARQLAVQQLTEWTGLPYDSDAVRTVEQVTAELASNAVGHGSLPGRDFRLTVSLVPKNTVHIEVTDTRPERQPPCPPGGPDLVDGDSEAAVSGRGLLLVEAFADRWGCTVCDEWTKTVWAQVRLG